MYNPIALQKYSQIIPYLFEALSKLEKLSLCNLVGQMFMEHYITHVLQYCITVISSVTLNALFRALKSCMWPFTSPDTLPPSPK